MKNDPVTEVKYRRGESGDFLLLLKTASGDELVCSMGADFEIVSDDIRRLVDQICEEIDPKQVMQ